MKDTDLVKIEMPLGLLKKIEAICAAHDDEGPEDEGWKSEELQAACAILAKAVEGAQ